VALLHLGSSSVADTTYLGRLFSLPAHSPAREAGHRAANHSSLRRPSSTAAAFSASVVSTPAHASLEGAAGGPLGPEARYEQAESISLAFVTALQLLPPRQLAVLILRDVLGFRASEVAGLLDSTVESVNSALKRARAGLERQRQPDTGREPAPAASSPAEDAIVARFVSAYSSADLGALVALLTDDAFVSMPPMPFEYAGADAVAGFLASLFGAGRTFDLVPTRANGQPAFGAYLRAPTGIRHGTGLIVLTLTGDRIRAMTRFEAGVLPRFGLPRSLPGR
jgi:RNA polymerase sigma-70 factor (TIGR02960 family)